MDWIKLFNAQKELDKHIEQEKGLEGQDLLDKKILALLVELGELANEWRGFKFWSNKQLPRLIGERGKLDVFGEPVIERYNPLLEEYVDCLHFILSIGNDLKADVVELNRHKEDNIVSQFIELNYQTYRVMQKSGWSKFQGRTEFSLLVDVFMGLGEMLGFTEEQIEQAYFKKNQINHDRQENNY